MLDTCHWSSLPQAAQLARGFHTPHSHFCAYIHWKAFFICTHPFLETQTGSSRPPRDFWLP